MPSTEAFNALACEFLDDLSSTFDEHRFLDVAHDSLKKMIQDNKCTPLPVCIWQSIVGGVAADAVRDRDPVVLRTLTKVVTSLGLGMDVQSAYDRADDATKGAIWEYIGGLHTMARTLADEGAADTVDLESVDTILASASSIAPANAEAMMNSMMCLVPPALKDLVDDKVRDCQQQIENGEISTEDIMEQMRASVSQLT